jgi:peroxin-6
VSNTLPFTYTGADLYALCSDAMLKAVTRAAEKVDRKVASYNAKLRHGESPITIAQFFDHQATDEDLLVSVTEEDFFAAQRELVPSVSAEEFGHYERVRRSFEGTESANGTSPDGPSSNGQKEQPKLKITQGQRKPTKALPERISTGSGGRSYQGSTNSATVRSPASKTPNTAGFGRPDSAASNKVAASERSTFYFDQATMDGHDDDDEEFVIRTDHLHGNTVNGGYNDSNTRTGFGFGNNDGPVQVRHSNGSVHGHGKMKSKGQGQGQGAAFGSATNGDDDLYQ